MARRGAAFERDGESHLSPLQFTSALNRGSKAARRSAWDAVRVREREENVDRQDLNDALYEPRKGAHGRPKPLLAASRPSPYVRGAREDSTPAVRVQA